jgi:hypothetical protein
MLRGQIIEIYGKTAKIGIRSEMETYVFRHGPQGQGKWKKFQWIRKERVVVPTGL